MAGMRSVNVFLVARYIVLVLFTICNAITCSVAVWNCSLVNQNQQAQVDAYLVFLGAFSLLWVFTLFFIEMLTVGALTTRVWFECAWVALFWVMELAGGAALIAIESDTSCVGIATAFAPCISKRVLLAFVWMCTIILLIYLLTLVSVAASHYYEEPKIWTSDVRRLGAGQRKSPSKTNSPLTTRFNKHASVDVYVPRPVRIKPVEPSHRPMGLRNYEIEPFPPVFVAPEQMDITYTSDLPEAIHLSPGAAPTKPWFMKPVPLLPNDRRNVMSPSLNHIDPPRELRSAIANARSIIAPGPTSSQRASLPPPPPLGDWPRRDIMQRPVRPKPRRRSPPPSAFEFPQTHVLAMPSGERTSMDGATQPRTRRPSGPRQRLPSSEGGHRPAPLDLTGISNYETSRWGDVV